MKNEIRDFLRQEPEWFRMSIDDLCWFLDLTEREIRQAISDLKLLALPKTKVLTNSDRLEENVLHFYTFTPHKLYRDEILILAAAKGRKSLPRASDLDHRMAIVRNGFEQFHQSMCEQGFWPQ